MKFQGQNILKTGDFQDSIFFVPTLFMVEHIIQNLRIKCG